MTTTRATKADLAERVRELEEANRRLEAGLERTKAVLAAVGSRLIEGRYLALPLTDEEIKAVREQVGDRVSDLAGEGRRLSGDDDIYGRYELVLENDDFYRSGTPLPQWDGYVAWYDFSREDGTYVERVWGLKTTSE
jgi:hypothetical protein